MHVVECSFWMGTFRICSKRQCAQHWLSVYAQRSLNFRWAERREIVHGVISISRKGHRSDMYSSQTVLRLWQSTCSRRVWIHVIFTSALSFVNFMPHSNNQRLLLVKEWRVCILCSFLVEAYWYMTVWGLLLQFLFDAQFENANENIGREINALIKLALFVSVLKSSRSTSGSYRQLLGMCFPSLQ